jgi:magnesium transporter
VIVDCAVYEDGRRRSGDLPLEHAYEACRTSSDAWVWIGLHEPDEAEFDSVTREFDLHELAVEDAIKAHQRPKLEAYEDSLFIVLKSVRYLEEEEALEFGEIHLFVGDGFIVSVRHGEARELHSIRQDIESKPELLRLGPGAVLHAIMDRIVDDYLAVVPALENDIDEVEEQVFSGRRENPAERIYKLERQVLGFHRATAPLVEPLDAIVRGRYALIHEEVHAYFRDVLDHLRRVVDQVEGFRDLLASVLEANLTQVSVRQNEDMRKISAWVAIIAVPTMIAGIYGMNFEHMPELKWELGYPLALAVMLVLCTGLYRYFKKIGWL